MIAYNPIAGGLLSGKHRREAGPMPGTRFTHPTAGARYRERYWHERELETVDALKRGCRWSRWRSPGSWRTR